MKKKIVIGCFALILLGFCGMSFLAALSGNQGEDAVGGDTPALEMADNGEEVQDLEPTSASASNTPTDIPEPKNTQEATATSPPLATQTATSTALPTPTVSSNANTENYELWLEGILERYGNGMLVLGEQNTAVSEDITLLNDRDWVIKTASALVMIEAASEEVISRENIPNEYRASHSEFVLMAELLLEFTNNYTVGVDTLDPSLIERSNSQLNEAMGHFENAIKLLPEKWH